MVINLKGAWHALERKPSDQDFRLSRKIPFEWKFPFLDILCILKPSLSAEQGGSDYVLSSQTEKLMSGTKFSDYLGLKHYKKAKN